MSCGRWGVCSKRVECTGLLHALRMEGLGMSRPFGFASATSHHPP